MDHYTHFTSPIRRYPDQIVSRILLGEKFTDEQLVEICTQANVQERKIEAMNEEYLQDRIESYLQSHPKHSGMIIHVSKWGIHVLLLHLRRTAQLHVSKLGSEKFIYADKQLTGSSLNYRLGDEVKIELKNDQWEIVF
jgi:ribonuclease R